MSSLFLPIRTHHLSPRHLRFEKQFGISPSQALSFNSSLSRFRGPRLLARAEEKARDTSSPPPSSTLKQPRTPSSEKQIQGRICGDHRFSWFLLLEAAGRSDSFKALGLTTPPGECYPICSVEETSSEEFEAIYKPKTDFLKALAVLAAAGTGAVAIHQSWVAANQDVAMAILFGMGYSGIIFEDSLAFNKSGVGLLLAVSLWVTRSIGNYNGTSIIEMTLTAHYATIYLIGDVCAGVRQSSFWCFFNSSLSNIFLLGSFKK